MDQNQPTMPNATPETGKKSKMGLIVGIIVVIVIVVVALLIF